MPRFSGRLVKYPARASFAWYFGLIAVGGLILAQPFCHVSGLKQPVSLLDALFTATSAACVTGLTVRSTGNEFSFAGQLVILALIQLGGIGIMTVTTYITYRLMGRGGLRERSVISETLGFGSVGDLQWVLRKVIGMTFFIEGLGFLLLVVRNLFDYPPAQAVWHALFHSVSAFCNAGFALSDDNLIGYQGDPLVNLTIAALVILGGIGFPVMLDVRANWHGAWARRWDRLQLHSKFMLIGTAMLIVVGTLSILSLEWDNAIKDMSFGRGLLVAFFQSVVCRTAGFNTVAIGQLTNATLFIMVLLMAVGAGPCSTAGGFKVSTLMLFIVRAWTTFRGYTRLSIFRRTIPFDLMARATTTVLLYMAVVIGALTVLLVLEETHRSHAGAQGIFLDSMFEIVSALSTVGLSTGLTPLLGHAGKLVLILTMFIGRLGPISVVMALSISERPQTIEYPREEPLIG
jgi:trk system potassium uptake protein TrkH